MIQKRMYQYSETKECEWESVERAGLDQVIPCHNSAAVAEGASTLEDLTLGEAKRIYICIYCH
jgi:hypothetical protein